MPSEPGCGAKCLTSIKMCAVMSLADPKSRGSIIWEVGRRETVLQAEPDDGIKNIQTSNEFILKAC